MAAAFETAFPQASAAIPSRAERRLRLALLVLAVLQLIVPYLGTLTGWGQAIGADAELRSARTPELPMSWAFAIWGPIFLLCFAYALLQSLPTRAPDAAYRRLAWPMAAAFTLSLVWMVMAQFIGDGVHLVIAIWLLWAAVVVAWRRRQGTAPSRAEHRWVVSPMLGLFAGWLSVAVWLNTTSVIELAHPDKFGLPDTLYALCTLLPAAGLAVALIRWSRGDPWYAAAVLWALFAVLVANLVREPNAVVAIIAAALIGVVVYAVLSVRGWVRRRVAPVPAPPMSRGVT